MSGLQPRPTRAAMTQSEQFLEDYPHTSWRMYWLVHRNDDRVVDQVQWNRYDRTAGEMRVWIFERRMTGDDGKPEIHVSVIRHVGEIEGETVEAWVIDEPVPHWPTVMVNTLAEIMHSRRDAAQVVRRLYGTTTDP
jgi:hypothetical protein